LEIGKRRGKKTLCTIGEILKIKMTHVKKDLITGVTENAISLENL
jgi:hypothetical protein